MINKPIIHRFFKDFTNHRKKTNRAALLSCRPFPNILKYSDPIKSNSVALQPNSFNC